jgi:hypothetical protein
MDDNRRAEIEAMAVRFHGHSTGYSMVGDVIDELLSALDHEHRATLRAEIEADRLWQEIEDMQASYLPSSRWRTREQIVGLVGEGE